MRILLIILSLLFSSVSYSQEISFDELLTEDGRKFSVEYIEYCRDRKGRFVKCSDGDFSKKAERRCRESETGRFIKCPN